MVVSPDFNKAETLNQEIVQELSQKSDCIFLCNKIRELVMSSENMPSTNVQFYATNEALISVFLTPSHLIGYQIEKIEKWGEDNFRKEYINFILSRMYTYCAALGLCIGYADTQFKRQDVALLIQDDYSLKEISIGYYHDRDGSSGYRGISIHSDYSGDGVDFYGKYSTLSYKESVVELSVYNHTTNFYEKTKCKIKDIDYQIIDHFVQGQINELKSEHKL